MGPKKILRIAIGTLSVGVATGVLFFAAAWIGEYRPAPRERVETLATPLVTRHSLPDTLTLISWNIGYAGLGDNMDFFYDGGSRVRDSHSRTLQNLDTILTTLRRLAPDIILLQEVDRHSHRSYGMDQVELLHRALPQYTLSFAYNYHVRWVPIPLCEPIGRVESGVATLSRIRPRGAERIDYPSRFAFPVRLFNLKRGVLSTQFVTRAGDTVCILNTHNTAYDTGGMRSQEMHFLSHLLDSLSRRGITTLTGGDWNQYPPHYHPSQAELSNPYFVPQAIDSTIFGPLRFVHDTLRSLRYLDRPYRTPSPCHAPLTTLTDFFLCSPKVRILSVETLPLNFRASDHNPVRLRIVINPSKSLE